LIRKKKSRAWGEEGRMFIGFEGLKRYQHSVTMRDGAAFKDVVSRKR
jgi:hypothetical protein